MWKEAGVTDVRFKVFRSRGPAMSDAPPLRSSPQFTHYHQRLLPIFGCVLARVPSLYFFHADHTIQA